MVNNLENNCRKLCLVLIILHNYYNLSILWLSLFCSEISLLELLREVYSGAEGKCGDSLSTPPRAHSAAGVGARLVYRQLQYCVTYARVEAV